jgi:hypothetical protein
LGRRASSFDVKRRFLLQGLPRTIYFSSFRSTSVATRNTLSGIVRRLQSVRI